MDELIVNVKMGTEGFVAGTKQLANAIKSFGSTVDRSMRHVQTAGRSILSTIMKWGPALLGVGGAYSVISKSVSAFMAQNQQLSTSLQACWNSIGSAIGPIIERVVNLIVTAVQYLMAFLKLLGVTTKGVGGAGKAAGAATKELKKQLMGFDELNVMQDQDDNGGGGGGAGGVPDIEPPDWMKKLSEWLKKVWDLLKNKQWDDAADMIIDGMNKLIYTFRDKAYELGDKIGEYLGGALHVIARVLDEVDWKALGEGIAYFLNGVMNHIDGLDLGRILVSKITIAIKVLTGFLENLNWAKLGQIFSDMVKGALDALSRAIEGANFQKIGAGIRTFFTNIDWEEIKDSLFRLLRDVWNGAVDLLWGLLAGESKEKPPLIKALEDLGVAAEKAAKVVIEKAEEIWKAIEPIIGETLTRFIKDLAEALDDLANLLSGKMNLGEFVTHMNGLEVALTAIAGIKLAGIIKGIEGLGTAIGTHLVKALGGEGLAAAANGVETATEAAYQGAHLATTAATETAAAAGTVAHGLGVVLGGMGGFGVLGIVGACAAGAYSLLDLADTMRHVGFIEEGLEIQDYVQNLLDMNQTLDSARQEFENLSNSGAIEGLQQQQVAVDTATMGVTHAMEQLADALGISTEELKKQIDAAGGDITQIEALSAENLKLLEIEKQKAQAFSDSYNNLVEVTDAYERGAKRIGDLEYAVGQYSNMLGESTLTQEQAESACNQLTEVLEVLRKKYGDSAVDMDLYKDVQNTMTEVSEKYNIALSEQAKILMDTEQTMRNSADASQASADAASQAADATNRAKESQEGLAVSMQETQKQSQQSVQDAEALEQEFGELGATGSKTGSEVTEGYTKALASGAPEMENTTKEVAGQASGAFADGLRENTKEVEVAAKEMTQTAISAIESEVQSGTQRINTAIQNSASVITSTIKNCGEVVSSTMQAINKIITEVFNNMISLSGQAGSAIAQNFAAGMTSLYQSAVEVAVNLNDVFGSYFGQIAQNGYVWGSDLGILFNNGLVDACNAYLMPTLNQVAQSIKNVIGFSKPKEGPLSDADTYMPDFMELLTKGVEENMDKPLDAVADLAEGVKGELADGDYRFGDFEAGKLDTAFAAFGTQFLDGFGALVDRLDAIAERVTYALPDVAAGSVLPYSVATGNAQMAESGGVNLSDVLVAIDSLKTFLTANSEESQGLSVNVFLDGEQIESAVSLRQRRKSMARGA